MLRTRRLYLPTLAFLINLTSLSCTRGPAREEVIVYCGVDEPYASRIFEAFEQQTGIHVAVMYDIESSKSVGLAGKLEAEKDHPRADVWWGSEAFLSVRLADEGILTPYLSPAAQDVAPQFRDTDGYWTGTALRARVLAVGQPPPPFDLKGLEDLSDPRLKDKVVMSRPTSGATGAHLAAMYSTWGTDRARAFMHRVHDNGIKLVGGNAEVANAVGNGSFLLGLTDNDDVSDAAANGGKLSMFVPDQGPDAAGTLAMPTTIALVKGASHEADAKKLIDFLISPQTERRLIDMHFARWSVRGGDVAGNPPIKAMPVDYRAAARIYPLAQREATDILEGRTPAQ
jgi:iron(III) transport system substrate-binding protein